MKEKPIYAGFLIVSLLLLVVSISGCINQNIPPQDNYQAFNNQKEMLDFFRNFISEKTEQFTPSAMIAIDPKKACESDDDCLLVSNYFSRLRVNCKIDPDAPGDWMVCAIPGSGSANLQEAQSSTEPSTGYLPEVGDPRYQWGNPYYTECLNPMNLNQSERDNLEIENGTFSTIRKCSCLTLAEYYQEPTIGETNESGGENTSLPDIEQTPPPTPAGDNDTAETSEINESDTQKYCLLTKKTSDLIVSGIDAPDYPLERGVYSFNITIKNLGPDKCCDTYQITEIFKDGEYWGSVGLHSTLECWYRPDGKGILPDQSVKQGTGLVNYNEAGTYTIKSDIKCSLPEEGNMDNGIFEVDIQIE